MNKAATQVKPETQIRKLERQVEALKAEIEELDERIDSREDDRLPLVDLALDGLKVEKPEEKQWFLEQIALRLGANLDRVIYEPAREPFPKPSAYRGYRGY